MQGFYVLIQVRSNVGDGMVNQKVTLGAACMLAEHDTSENMKKIIGFIEEAAKEGVQLLVFPECCLQGYLWTWDWEEHIFKENEEQKRYYHKVAEPIPGASTEIIAKYAARYGMLVQVGMVERVDNGGEMALYNSAAIIGPEGVVGTFRKVHSVVERLVFKQGREFPVFDTFVGKIGPIICADLLYPESVRVLALKGAEIITMSTAWGMDPNTDDSLYRYDLLGRANAVMNGVWMVMSDQVGVSRRSEERCVGHSCIIDPTGNIVASIGYEEGLVTARIDVEGGIKKADRAYSARDKARCPESYRIISAEL